MMLSLVGYAGHAIGATLFVTLALLVHRRDRHGWLASRWVLASLLTATSSLLFTTHGLLTMPVWSVPLAETLRNAGWLLVVAALGSPTGAPHRSRVSKALTMALGGILVAQMLVNLVSVTQDVPAPQRVGADWLLRCVFAIGMLFYLQRQFARRSAAGMPIPGYAWLAAALTVLWVYDFNHYLLSWLTGGPSPVIDATRGYVLAAIAPMMALSLFEQGERPVRVSRPVAMRLVSGAIIVIYFLCVLLFVVLSRGAGQGNERLVELVVLFALSVAVLVLLPPTTVRSWLRVAIAKHLFAHRYDYRAEWMRFAATVAATGREAPPLGNRVAQAMAQVIESSSALLLLREPDGALKGAGHWNWPEDSREETIPPELAAAIETRGWIVDLAGDKEGEALFTPILPDWIAQDRTAWVIAPLLHREILIGVVLLSRPAVARRPDWEDLDVLRVVGSQAAATISEARSREALDEAQRFDEFNRRFAFILHDLKNLVSQMSLLASNAERHADNPAFRADMIFTLKETAGRMTDMLARLVRKDLPASSQARGLDLRATLLAAMSRIDPGGRVCLTGEAALAQADADGLERAVGHLVRNALEACAPDARVEIRLADTAGQPTLQVIDEGSGMSADFIRNQLFRPFASTKANGFGLGAHEARLLVSGMGGTLTVESREGAGTCFTIALLPAASAQPRAEATLNETPPQPDPARPTRRTA